MNCRGAQIVVQSVAPTQVSRGSKRDLGEGSDRSATPATALLLSGVALCFSGIALTLGGALSVLGSGAMITVGAGVALFGLLKRSSASIPQAVALPATSTATSPEVLAERARRVSAVLESGREATFEVLLEELRWTDAALLEALVAMKDAGALTEDLDMDLGEWVYRAHALESAPKALAERQDS